MQLSFYKYHGAGNDFILVDNRTGIAETLSQPQIEHLCSRHKGVGADGLLLLNTHPQHAFELLYFNADGHPGSLCGNGSRCAVKFAHQLGFFPTEGTFQAYDGPHLGQVLPDGSITIQLYPPTEKPRLTPFGWFLDTGSPHVVQLLEELDLKTLDVVGQGRNIRYHSMFEPGGTNVNFVRPLASGHLAIRTYERGVEDETLACGTGVTAAAWVYAQHRLHTAPWELTLEAMGGTLRVSFNGQLLMLTGPAMAVYEGTVSL
jgi:diaminopimelate epimerase